MNTNDMMHHAQARLDGILEQAATDPILGPLASPTELKGYLQAGFSAMLKAAMLKERTLYLERQSEDRGNGFAPLRDLHVGTTPVTVERPRTRYGFYPAFLPKHQRHIPAEYQALLEQILIGAKSFEAALRTMQHL